MNNLLPKQLQLPQLTIAEAGASKHLEAEAAKRFGPRGFVLRRGMRKSGEPTTDEVDALRQEFAANRPDWVAAIGGGSVLDLAKAAAGLVDAPERTAYYQRNPQEIPEAGIPLIAVPTTAGTGSEATVVSVLTDTAVNFKQSIRHPSWMPKMVILDSDLLDGCPTRVIAASGADAFVQAYESYVSRYADPFTQALAMTAMETIREMLPRLHRGERDAAMPMLQASYITGLAFSHSRLGLIHGFAHPLGARYHVPHGEVCAACLKAAVKFNADSYRPDIDWLEEILPESPFRGKPILDREAIIDEVLGSGSTAANPREVTAEAAGHLLDEIFGG